eukprot:CAMPEP_0119572624 /NCGR_PEP_ID=MMETSP1352-20130426/44712_1 /TAXON_ID=265584 /ORGANISM="Stauroneis constricta, Strain CCMP1120" /LENGTH=453 /DNA_ID=CAMNT_0007622309 /DNA_START=638 /DNA_END=1999 /DNA_ORIENTATION=-
MKLSTMPQVLLTDPTTAELSERLDAARMLLGVSPSRSPSLPSQHQHQEAPALSGTRVLPLLIPKQNLRFQSGKAVRSISDADTTLETASLSTSTGSSSSDGSFMAMMSRSRRRSRSNSAGLDALAFLATKEQASMAGQQQQQQQAQPLQPPRQRMTRFQDEIPRSGLPPRMPATSSSSSSTATLPTALLHVPGKNNSSNVAPVNAVTVTPASGLPSLSSSAATSDTSDSEMTPATGSTSSPPPKNHHQTSNPNNTRRRSMSNPEGMMTTKQPRRVHFILPETILEMELAEASSAIQARREEELILQQETSLTNEELLRRARSRLLEDMSLVHEKGNNAIVLPHSLAKYKNIYNQNGRIGIYTPLERAAIISRYHEKRTRRVWNKRIRYNCRKNLADRRLRIKGRFVKRSVVESSKADEQATAAEDETTDDATTTPFAPTDDMPFRRPRRHTIT